MSAKLADEINKRLLTRCPVNVKGVPDRRREIFDSVFIYDDAFLAILEMLHSDRSPPAQKYSRSVQDRNMEEILLALENPDKSIVAPVGIAGYDFIDVRGSRLVNLARPVANLTSVNFVWNPPMPRAETPDGVRYAPAYWTQEIQYNIKRISISLYEFKKLRASHTIIPQFFPDTPAK
jgi:hypothetical protein